MPITPVRLMRCPVLALVHLSCVCLGANGQPFNYEFVYTGSELVFPVDRDPYYYPSDRPFDRVEGRLWFESPERLTVGFSFSSNSSNSTSGSGRLHLPKENVDFRFTDGRLTGVPGYGPIITPETASSWNLLMEDPFNVGYPTNYLLTFTNDDDSYEDNFYIQLYGYVDFQSSLAGEDVSYYPQRNAYRHGSWTGGEWEPDARVLLEIGEDAPFGAKHTTHPKTGRRSYEWDTSTTSPAYTPPNLAAIEATAEAIYLKAGVYVDFVTNEADLNGEEPDLKVYFSDIYTPYTNLGGLASYGKYDSYFGDKVIVYAEGLPTNVVSQVLAHEVGHAFGLRHTVEDPNAVMFPEINGFNEEFLDSPKMVEDSSETTNATYYLQRFVRETGAVDSGLEAGTFDDPSFFECFSCSERGRLGNFNVLLNLPVYDFTALRGIGSASAGDGELWEPTLEQSQIAVDEIGLLNLLNSPKERYLAYGSSTPGGDPDIFLETISGNAEIGYQEDGEDVVLRLYNGDGSSTILASAVWNIETGLLEGDFNNDGVVDNGDLSLLLGSWGGSAVPSEWVNGFTGTVDNDELSALLGGWGAGLTAVPEPSAFSVFSWLCGIQAHIGTARRKQRQRV